MTTPKKINQKDFIDEVLKLKKELFELRFKKVTQQNIKPHLFKQTKRRLAQLFTMYEKIYIE